MNSEQTDIINKIDSLLTQIDYTNEDILDSVCATIDQWIKTTPYVKGYCRT